MIPATTITMTRLLITFLGCVFALICIWGLQGQLIAAKKTESGDRVQVARTLREEKLRNLCSDHNLPYPPKELFLRAFKREQLLEVWAGSGDGKQLELLATYPLTAFSGVLGPKRREGDRQIPEGFYHIERFNPRSSFHLSLGLNYPNESDRKFADPQKPGSDIFIHGRNASVGCLAIGDPAIEELYILAKDVSDRSNSKIPVHIFPARMDGSEWKPEETAEAKADPGLHAFWEDLGSIYTKFEESKRVPDVEVTATGRYQLRDSLKASPKP